MKKTICYIAICFLCCTMSFGQELWKGISLEKANSLSKMDRASLPSKYKLYSLDMNVLKSRLVQAPKDNLGIRSMVILSFPNSEGGLNKFAFYESPIMEQGLADQFPDVKTYSAIGIDDPTAKMRISITPFGLHAMVVSGNSSTMYIDTYSKDLNNYIVYRKSNITASRTFNCEFNEPRGKSNPTGSKNNIVQKNSDSNFRVYRLAVACTGEYATFHGGTVALAQAAIVVTVNRVNLVYENDFSVRLVLVANNTSLLYTNGTTDPFDNNAAGTLIGQSQTIINGAIGAANYDVGHTVSTGGGGLAGLGVICNNSQKARGITGSPAPVGDPYDIDYVAHEMGHQFGGNHTFNNSCGGNRNSSTAVEPGSGSTIMAYAGICAPDVQSNSDSHFHAVSIGEIETVILATSCPVTTANGNTPPVVNAGLDYTIPKSTPFILKGTATDVNGDALTYCWEQTNTEISTQAPVATSTGGPNFRSNPPVSSPDRYMPTIQEVINNNLAPTWEVVPSVARTMSFALTVRDNRSPNGGQTKRDDMVVTTANVGPFLVSTPNTAISWTVGTNQSVTWDVAGTTANGINATNVDILLSTDGGFTYPILLASKVPNDGSETITVPNNVGNQNRIMVRGYRHLFYDISNTNFTIAAATSSFAVSFSGVAEEQNKSTCSNSITYNISYSALGGFSGTTSFSATGAPVGATIGFSPTTMSSVSGTVVMTIGNLSAAANGSFAITVTATSGAVSKTIPFYLTSGGAITLSTPVNNATGQAPSLTLTWSSNPNAASYTVQVSTNNTFTAIVSTGSVTTPSYTVSGLVPSTQYFWRVLPVSPTCTTVYTAPFSFTTGTLACATTVSTNVPIAISAAGTPTVTSTLSIPSGGTISDLNVNLNIQHTWINDLTATLTSPAGTTVQLFSRQCNPGASVNDIDATFDDAGIAIACGDFPGISGTVLPAQVLSAFNGQTSTGTWTLTVSDAFNADGGSINAWSLNICSVTLGVAENEFTNFNLFPNPNNGDFTVKLTSGSSENIKVNVYDISGRQVYENSYANTGTFDQNVSLDNIQAGVYLVSIADGTKKTVRRVVIQ